MERGKYEMLKLLIFLPLLLTLVLAPTLAFATNEGSYKYGYWEGSLTGPRYGSPGGNWYPEFDNTTCDLKSTDTLTYPNVVVIPGVTNTTACNDGWYHGFKAWCTNHAVDCVGNITMGQFPPMIIQAKEQYNMGFKAANGSGNLCPIGENAAFCLGYYSNNGDDYDCEDSNDNGTFASHSLIGCPLDTMNENQMAKPHALLGTWNYVNGSISGKIVYSDYGNFTLTVPIKNAFGDYHLEGSWGSLGHNLLTQCYPYGACQNNTLTIVTPNHIEFSDPNHNTIHLMRDYFHMTRMSMTDCDPNELVACPQVNREPKKLD